MVRWRQVRWEQRIPLLVLVGGCLVGGVLILGIVLSAPSRAERQPSADRQSSSTPMSRPMAGPHHDHHPKHGGEFFMALDNQHHLEGVLLPPGEFCVYLYDAYTRPLSPEQMREASAYVQEGTRSPIRKPLRVSKDGERLEADFGRGLKLPATFTLRIRFPGSAANAKPELFTFPFRRYTAAGEVRSVDAPGGMPETPEHGAAPDAGTGPGAMDNAHPGH